MLKTNDKRKILKSSLEKKTCAEKQVKMTARHSHWEHCKVHHFKNIKRKKNVNLKFQVQNFKNNFKNKGEIKTIQHKRQKRNYQLTCDQKIKGRLSGRRKIMPNGNHLLKIIEAAEMAHVWEDMKNFFTY